MEVRGLKLLIAASRDLYFTKLTSMHLVLPAVLASMSQTEIQSNAAYTRRGANQHAQTKQVRNDSGGGGVLANFLIKFVKSEVFVGVAHSAEQ